MHLADAYSERSQTSTMKFFCKSSSQLNVVNYFCEKPPSQIFHWVINTPLLCELVFFKVKNLLQCRRFDYLDRKMFFGKKSQKKSKSTLYHCVKSARIWSFSSPFFPAFRLNTDQKSPNMSTFHAVIKRYFALLFETFHQKTFLLSK